MYNKHVNENKTDQNVSLKWHHITVYSPYRGGLWERAVKTVEETMQAMSFGKSYKFEEFVSQISDVQYIVNSRSGANDFDAPITPLMMLKGDRNCRGPKSLGIVGLATLQMNIIDNNQNNGNLSIIKNITQNDDDNNNDYNNIVNDKNIDISSSSATINQNNSNTTNNNNNKLHTGCKKRGRKRKLPISNDNNKPVVVNNNNSNDDLSTTTITTIVTNPVKPINDNDNNQFNNANDTKILKTTPANVDIKYEIPEGNLIRVEPRRGRPPKIKQTSTSFTTIQNQQVPRLSPLVLFAQNFTGSNNINQLRRHGQFGTRFEGGTDAAQPPSNLVPN
ncbi:hypothetical protein HUG17_6439 [Dermatophagoides farinae]|uniref:Uncharacterized protein n=1 Tax=Dermatophagoides farinae TaxID=6954 RepID=A0A9D4SJC2_DERFA|nr:hypothetical protein HUG17_6439 [Dermatophagoides farinae]